MPDVASPHHEHGVYHGNDSWDAECCICCDNPCDAVDVERMRGHRRWDIERLHKVAARFDTLVDMIEKSPW